MPKLVFFSGPAGTGKTTISKKMLERIPAIYLDKDTVGGRAVEKILEISGMDVNDRDSGFYKEYCRDLEYDSTMDVALENLEVGLNAFLIGPFTKELSDKKWIDRMLKRVGLTQEEVDVKVIIVTLSDMDAQKERIIERNTDRDNWKLNNWSEFVLSLKEIEVNWNIPEENLLRFDNSGELTDKKLKEIETFINQ